MRFVKHLEIAARRWRNLFNTTNAHAPERTNKHSNSGIVPLEELENRTLLSATPFTLEPSGNEAPAVVAAGLAAIDPEDSLIAGDLDSDGFVGISDLNIILGNWNDNVPPGNPAADPSGDGFVGINDLNIILGNWNNSAIVDTFSGLTVNGRIIHGSDVDTYSINAQAGDDLFVSFSELAAFTPGMNVAIYGPTNVLLASANNSSSANLEALNLAQTGTYTIVMSDTSSNDAYDYTLTAVVIDNTIDADNVALTSGQTVTDTISLGDIDTFTISAQAGDDLFVSFSELSASSPGMEIDVYGPNSTLLTLASNDSAGNLEALNLAQSGTYTIVVRDTSADNTYDYTLTAVVIDNTIDSDNVALTSGQTVNGNIALGDIDTFTISAQAGDDLFVSFSELSASSPGMEFDLYGPNSTLLTSASNDSAGNLEALNLAQSGTYTIVVRDTGADSTYDYTLTAVVIDNTIDADNVALTSGQTVNGTIALADIDTFTITAQAGDDLFVNFSELSASSPGLEIDIYGPNSTLLTSASNDSAGMLEALSLAQSGTYTIVVRDTGADSTYDYTLTAVVIDNTIDADNVVLTSGQTVTDTISLGDIDTFTINASAGDDLFVSFSELSASSPGMEIDVYGPNSTLLTLTSNDSAGNLEALNLAQSGTYTIVVRDTGADNTYDYTLTAVVIDNVIDAGNVALNSGQAVNDTIGLGDIDTFTISASVGDDLLVSFMELAAFTPGMEVDVYAPNSTLLISASNDNMHDLQVFNLAVSGTYTIIIRDTGADDTYDYTLTATVTS